MTLLRFSEMWCAMAGLPVLWAAVAPLAMAVLYLLFGFLRECQRHFSTRMIVRESPAGTVVRSTIRRGRSETVFVVEVGHEQARPSDVTSLTPVPENSAQ
ncbi:hypothetical protein [Nocardia sp. NPDC051750]|uniref:hypothetical protein n=1 Tax=Nocardia sp. NPDC051750 TaxID=3364325 RepID=UPI00378E8AEA